MSRKNIVFHFKMFIVTVVAQTCSMDKSPVLMYKIFILCYDIPLTYTTMTELSIQSIQVCICTLVCTITEIMHSVKKAGDATDVDVGLSTGDNRQVAKDYIPAKPTFQEPDVQKKGNNNCNNHSITVTTLMD